MITDKEKAIATGRTYHQANKLKLKMGQRGWTNEAMADEIGKPMREVLVVLLGYGDVEVMALMLQVCERS